MTVILFIQVKPIVADAISMSYAFVLCLLCVDLVRQGLVINAGLHCNGIIVSMQQECITIKIAR
jgi:hypothetical protein